MLSAVDSRAVAQCGAAGLGPVGTTTSEATDRDGSKDVQGFALAGGDALPAAKAKRHGCQGTPAPTTKEQIMIAFYRNVSIAAGKVGSAVAFAKQIAQYVKDKHGLELSIAMPVAGNPNRIGWAARYESLGAFETTMNAVNADPGYLELVAKGSENFIAGTVHDEIWRTL
jgi:hypothetical protein